MSAVTICRACGSLHGASPLLSALRQVCPVLLDAARQSPGRGAGPCSGAVASETRRQASREKAPGSLDRRESAVEFVESGRVCRVRVTTVSAMGLCFCEEEPAVQDAGRWFRMFRMQYGFEVQVIRSGDDARLAATACSLRSTRTEAHVDRGIFLSEKCFQLVSL